MKLKIKLLLPFFFLALIISSCESRVEKEQREAKELQQRIQIKARKEKEAKEVAFQKEQKRIEREKEETAKRIKREAKLKKEREEKAIYDRYINNSLRTGDTPYAYCFGSNNSCSNNGCSQIKVTTPVNSDVLVTIKKNGKVYRHAYINSNSSYTFEFPNGSYQTYFYYGKGWNPNKIMKKTNCGTLKGGFITNEHFGKDNLQTLNNNILEYELILQQNGNFSTKPSNSEEAF
ncbi:cell envelope integrity protein TolA [Polaribacter butkevichii]|uniref:Lipoprotein n=1 Tax=Polaribacter butkevichii TaxID=218490 RepID=A0A2P6CCY1_9FLAO|nr:cell envelope integrity protein TolA [Polaribacter butkevichii]PQJ72766.1 hypothetical protein BTO14_05620 [Polaribacter butkevichii]